MGSCQNRGGYKGKVENGEGSACYREVVGNGRQHPAGGKLEVGSWKLTESKCGRQAKLQGTQLQTRRLIRIRIRTINERKEKEKEEEEQLGVRQKDKMIHGGSGEPSGASRMRQIGDGIGTEQHAVAGGLGRHNVNYGTEVYRLVYWMRLTIDSADENLR